MRNTNEISALDRLKDSLWKWLQVCLLHQISTVDALKKLNLVNLSYFESTARVVVAWAQGLRDSLLYVEAVPAWQTMDKDRRDNLMAEVRPKLCR